jgi:uncharacterized OsmC-like protein
MATSSKPDILNGVDVGVLRQYIETVEADPRHADRDPEVIARWVGGTRAEVVAKSGGAPVYMGGDDDPSAMGMMLRALVACDVEVLITRAALMGVEVQELTIEGRGYFHVARYLGIDAPESAGYQRASCTVHIKAPGASTEQLEELRVALATSPAGDTFERRVPMTYDLAVD